MISGSQTCICWFDNPEDTWYFALIPVGIAQLIVIYCYITSLYVSFAAISQTGLYTKLSVESKCILRRLVALPTIFFLLWVPTTIYRLFDSTHNKGEFLPYLWLSTFPTTGIFDAIVFVFTDDAVLREWKFFLLCQPIRRPEGKSESKSNSSIGSEEETSAMESTSPLGKSLIGN